jgi:hypothetical protein
MAKPKQPQVVVSKSVRLISIGIFLLGLEEWHIQVLSERPDAPYMSGLGALGPEFLAMALGFCLLPAFIVHAVKVKRTKNGVPDAVALIMAAVCAVSFIPG